MEKYDINSHVGPEIKTVPLYGHGTPVIDMNDFPYVTESAEAPENDSIEELSMADTPWDYSDIIEQSAFVGEVPFNTIVDGITNQFDDYIGTEDHTDYVEIFFNQLHDSYDMIDDEEEHPVEIRDALDKILSEFVTTVSGLFKQRLCISLVDLEAEDIDYDDIEYEISILYDFFIINAKSNFRTVIVRDVCNKLNSDGMDDKQFNIAVNDMMRYYSPLVIAIGPMEFIQLTENYDVYQLYQDGKVTGNFLKKYSPRFFQYEDFEVDIIADITLRKQAKADLLEQINTKSL